MKSLATNIFAAISLNLLITAYAYAQAVDYSSLDLVQGFYFKKTNHATLGYITDLQIGSTIFRSDISVINPVTNEKKNIVAPISSYKWGSLPSEPMQISLNISQANNKKLNELLKKSNAALNIEFNFQIYSFDPEKNEFYLALKSFTFPKRGIMNRIGYALPSNKLISLPIKGVIRSVAPAKSANTVVVNPENYEIQVVIAPPPDKVQMLVRATSSESLMKAQWGVEKQ